MCYLEVTKRVHNTPQTLVICQLILLVERYGYMTGVSPVAHQKPVSDNTIRKCHM